VKFPLLAFPCTISLGGAEMVNAHDGNGQGLLEYALLLVLVAIVVIIIVQLLGPATGNLFSNVVNNI
jgi:pilus assembly protein Flp/PilA